MFKKKDKVKIVNEWSSYYNKCGEVVNFFEIGAFPIEVKFDDEEKPTCFSVKEVEINE